MKTTAIQIINDSNYEQVPVEELPVPVVYRHKTTRNCVFLVGGKAFDQFMILRDVDGKCFYDYRKSGLLARIGNIAEAAAGLLILGTSPRVTTILDIFGVNTDQIGKAVDKISGVLSKESVQVLIRELGTDELHKVYSALQAALSDGVLTVDEWKAIQALAAA